MYHRPLPRRIARLTQPRRPRFHRFIARHSLAVSLVLAATLTVALFAGQLAQCSALNQ